MGTPLPPPSGYEALRSAVAWANLGQRSTLMARGRDAVRFIDNFTTAAVAPLAAGQGTEGFFTDARGWVLTLASLLRTEEGVVIDAPAGISDRLHAHLEHYHIREQVEIDDVSADRANILIAGPRAGEWIVGRCDVPPPTHLLGHVQCRLDGIPLLLVCVDWTGPGGYWLQVDRGSRQRLLDLLSASGMPQASDEAIETARIEDGRPGPDDIPEKTLPQELGRDARAISFTKGCYLGQETVARIDALGHVNRRLAAVATAGTAPRVGAEVRRGADVVGRITSSCVSPLSASGLALALLQCRDSVPDGPLDVEGVPARVLAVPLPLSPPAAKAGDGEILLEARRFRVVRVSESGADGAGRSREIVQHPGSVVILPLVSPREVCLVEVVRVAVGRTLLELPAGTLDRVESLEEAARRELAEETGYRAGRMTATAEFWMSPGLLRERMHLFVAEDLVAGSQALEPGEQIRTRVVDWDEAVSMCRDGGIEDAKTVAAILLVDARRRAAATGSPAGR